MKKRRAREKTKLSPPRGRDVFVLTMLLVLLMFLVLASDNSLSGAATGNFIIGSGPVPYQDELWEVPTCTDSSAVEVARELIVNYGCEESNCYQAAYGLTLPYNVIVQVNGCTSDDRTEWISFCNKAVDALCA